MYDESFYCYYLTGYCFYRELSMVIGFRDSLDDKSKANLVQIKGRFSVTSENVDLVKVKLSTYSQYFWFIN